MGNGKRSAEQAGLDTYSTGSSKISRTTGGDLSARTQELARMADKCNHVSRNFRHMDWTTYARQAHILSTFNFGNGLEPAVKCFGCRRILPPVLITGDHITPQSDKQGLRESIAYRLDGFDQALYGAAIGARAASLRSEPYFAYLQVIKAYDDGLEKDLRNIQPLCWYCNTKKGKRIGVQLYLDSARLPIRPHEAPF